MSLEAKQTKLCEVNARILMLLLLAGVGFQWNENKSRWDGEEEPANLQLGRMGSQTEIKFPELQKGNFLIQFRLSIHMQPNCNV